MAVLIVAFFALRNPKHATSEAGSDTRSVTPSVSATAPAPTSSSASPSPTTTKKTHKPSPSHATSTTAVGSLPLIVVNDTSTAHLARDAASRFEGGGWNVTTYDETFSNVISSTAAYYDPNVAGAKKAAEALQTQYPTIKRVVARFAPAGGGDALPDGPIVVVLTSDYAPN